MKTVIGMTIATLTYAIPAPAVSHEWYSGGTLHKATVLEWSKGTEGDQLATSADFAATILKKGSETVGSV